MTEKKILKELDRVEILFNRQVSYLENSRDSNIKSLLSQYALVNAKFKKGNYLKQKNTKLNKFIKVKSIKCEFDKNNNIIIVYYIGNLYEKQFGKIYRVNNLNYKWDEKNLIKI